MAATKSKQHSNDTHVIRFTVLAFGIGAIIALGFIASWFDNSVLWMALVAGGITGGFTFWNRVQQHDYINQLMHEPESQVIEVVKEVYRDLPRHSLVIKDSVVIYQPSAGAFSRLLGGAVASTREMFSLRRALEQGYNEQQYAVLVAQLQLIGWLSGELRNDAPLIADEARGEIGDWLGMKEGT